MTRPVHSTSFQGEDRQPAGRQCFGRSAAGATYAHRCRRDGAAFGRKGHGFPDQDDIILDYTHFSFAHGQARQQQRPAREGSITPLLRFRGSRPAGGARRPVGLGCLAGAASERLMMWSGEYLRLVVVENEGGLGLLFAAEACAGLAYHAGRRMLADYEDLNTAGADQLSCAYNALSVSHDTKKLINRA